MQLITIVGNNPNKRLLLRKGSLSIILPTTTRMCSGANLKRRWFRKYNVCVFHHFNLLILDTNSSRGLRWCQWRVERILVATGLWAKRKMIGKRIVVFRPRFVCSDSRDIHTLQIESIISIIDNGIHDFRAFFRCCRIEAPSSIDTAAELEDRSDLNRNKFTARRWTLVSLWTKTRSLLISKSCWFNKELFSGSKHRGAWELNSKLELSYNQQPATKTQQTIKRENVELKISHGTQFDRRYIRQQTNQISTTTIQDWHLLFFSNQFSSRLVLDMVS